MKIQDIEWQIKQIEGRIVRLKNRRKEIKDDIKASEEVKRFWEEELKKAKGKNGRKRHD